MGRMPTPEDFVGKFGGKEKKQKKLVNFATVVSVEDGLFLQFKGEDSASIKDFPRLESYTPAVNDPVAVVHGVVFGKIVKG